MYLLALTSFILSFCFVWLIKELLGKQLLDIPNERSSHIQPIPRGGGLGFIIAFLIVSIIANIFKLIPYSDLYCWLILTPLIIIGVLDDRFGLPSKIRYLVQLSTGIIAVYLYHPFPQPWLIDRGISGEILAIILTIIGFTALINFYNFMDGLDGLVAGCSVIQLGFLAIYFNQTFLWLLVTAILGFLYWNWHKAKIFMGDTGSTFIGAIVGIILLNSHQNISQTWSALAITFPLIIDAIYTLFCRLLRRENIFQAHRNHLFQRLQQSGWSHSQVAISYMSINLLIAISIINFKEMAAWGTLFGMVIVIAIGEIYLLVNRHLATTGRFHFPRKIEEIGRWGDG